MMLPNDLFGVKPLVSVSSAPAKKPSKVGSVAEVPAGGSGNAPPSGAAARGGWPWPSQVAAGHGVARAEACSGWGAQPWTSVLAGSGRAAGAAPARQWALGGEHDARRQAAHALCRLFIYLSLLWMIFYIVSLTRK